MSYVPPPRSLRIACPPKINLYLRIVRRRDDGYHELATVFQSVSGGDILYATEADELILTCDAEGVPTDESNLVLKAARLFQERYPEVAMQGAAFHLEKRTPVGAGMGGGSVNGAAALRLLTELWALEPDGEELAQMAAQLGSDVPFFLEGGTALGGGRGEELSPLPTAPLWLTLVRPPVGVNTGWAYRQWIPTEGGSTIEAFTAALASGDPVQVAGALRNDLELGVAAGLPEIEATRKWLQSQGAVGVMMTGSGSVVFGLARDQRHAEEMAAATGAPGTAWACRCLTREEAALVPQRV